MICLKIDQYKSILFRKQKVSDTLYRDKVRPDVWNYAFQFLFSQLSLERKLPTYMGRKTDSLKKS